MSDIKEIAISELPDNNVAPSLIDDASLLLSQEAHEGYVSPEKVRNRIEEGRMIVAIDQVAGLVGAGLLRLTGEATASITGVAISPQYRGKGLGTKIITELEKLAKAEQVRTIYLTPTNIRAEKLYERLGYRVPNSEMLTMEKILPDSHHESAK
jgi:ribosomal protein S18 acetylase RimI-like enzyme